MVKKTGHPYVYKGIHKSTGQFYFGFRSQNKVPAVDDLGSKYRTSSKYVNALGFENFEWIIIAEFFTADDAYWFEQELIKEHIANQNCLNRYYTDDASGQRKFSMAGMKHTDEQRARQSKRMSGRTVPESTKLAVSKSMKGKVKTEEHQRNINKALIGRQMPPKTEEHKEKHRIATTKMMADMSEEARIVRGNKISKSKKGKKIKPRSDDANRKAADSLRKPISCDGVIYPSRVEAAKHYGVRPETISARAVSDKFPEFFFVKKEKDSK